DGMPSDRQGPPWQWGSQFSSKKDVVDHWFALLGLDMDSTGPRSLTSPDSLDFVFSPGTGWRYVISVATPDDNKALTALGDEFTRNHSTLFSRDKRYQGVDKQIWSKYLGFHDDGIITTDAGKA
ncbi:unnamed protein product, partial [Polarella glacialis]